MTPLRTLAFGDGSAWGTSWSADPTGLSLTALGNDGEITTVSAVPLPDAGSDADWRLEGEDVSLAISPVGELVDVQADQDGTEGWNQLCHVTGRYASDDIDCLGLRSEFSDAVDLTRFESIRAVSVWFDPAEGFALTAFRPRKAKSHDRDLLAAAVIAAEGSAAVEEPRLSTTYAADGWPSRAGLELWLAEAGEGEGESERQYPRRASGEAIGGRAQTEDGELTLRAQPFRWHSRGREGTGMYLLARRR
jgi:hypothetical protein